MNSPAVVAVVVEDAAALRALYEDHLSKGRAFVMGASGVVERQSCELVVEHQGRTLSLAAEVVFVRAEDPGRGVGLQLARLDTTRAAALKAFIDAAAPAPETPDEEADPVSATTAEQPGGEASEETEEAGSEEEEEPGASGDGRIQSIHDRVHKLTGQEQLKLAAAGTLAERTALERMVGPTVWETLLRNPRVTLPEVARIARKGSLPRPMVELIAANKPWLASGEVQRALLSNPRSSSAVILKVLSAMSRHDLQLVPQQSAYPETVRAAAKKRLGR